MPSASTVLATNRVKLIRLASHYIQTNEYHSTGRRFSQEVTLGKCHGMVANHEPLDAMARPSNSRIKCVGVALAPLQIEWSHANSARCVGLHAGGPVIKEG